MIHEAFGLNDMVRGHADRLAAAGYLTLAVDLFQRRRPAALPRRHHAQLGPGKRHGPGLRAGLAGRLAPDHGKVGVIGFCMGGGFALLMARDGFDAASVNYGRLPRNPEQALLGACPLVGNFGRKDRTLPGAAAKLESALDTSGSNTTSRNSRRPATPS